MLDLVIAELEVYEKRLGARVRGLLIALHDAQDPDKEALRQALRRCAALRMEATRALSALRIINAANFPAMPRFHMPKTVGALIEQAIGNLIDVEAMIDTRAEATRGVIVEDT